MNKVLFQFNQIIERIQEELNLETVILDSNYVIYTRHSSNVVATNWMLRFTEYEVFIKDDVGTKIVIFINT